MSMRGIVGLVVLAVVAFVGFSSFFTLHQTQQALVLEFGAIKKATFEPGLHFKMPWQTVIVLDRRVLEYDARVEEIPTVDQSQIVVNAFARYRIADPETFFKRIGNEQAMEEQLATFISSNQRRTFGSTDIRTLLSAERTDLMTQIAQSVAREAEQYGVEVLDVRLKRVDLTEKNTQAVFERMATEREQEARRIRAEGERESRKIRADADRQARVIVADATKQSEILRGEGDALAQNIANEAFGRDVEFYRFWKSMAEYRRSLGEAGATNYIAPPTVNDFFEYFGSIDGRRNGVQTRDGTQ